MTDLDVIPFLNIVVDTYIKVLISENAYLLKNLFKKLMWENYVLTFKYQGMFFDVPSWSWLGIHSAFWNSLIKTSTTILPHVFRN